MSTATPARRLLSRPERQATILRGAAQAFAHAGYAATSMDDVAAASGITKLIVYRHFDSKDALYRAVLEQVSARLAEEFVRGVSLADPDRRGFACRTLLTVAREEPDAFTLLWRHAVREPEFAEYAAGFRQGAEAAAERLIAPGIHDPAVRRWAARTIISYLVEAVLHWLDDGDPARDPELIERATTGLVAIYETWAD